VARLACVGIKVVVTIALGVTPLHFRVNQALPNGLLGYIFVIVAVFLFAFAIHADGFMIDNGKNSGIGGRQFSIAALALNCAG
jgi:hypothetical protein